MSASLSEWAAVRFPIHVGLHVPMEMLGERLRAVAPKCSAANACAELHASIDAATAAEAAGESVNAASLYELVIRALEHAEEHALAARLFEKLAAMRLERGEVDEAGAALRQAGAMWEATGCDAPADGIPPLHDVVLGGIYLHRRNWEAALEAFERGLVSLAGYGDVEIDRIKRMCVLGIAICRVRLVDFAGAIQTMREATWTSFIEDEPQVYGIVTILRAAADSITGNTRGSRESWVQLERLARTRWSVWCLLASGAAALGEHRRARAYFATAVASAGDASECGDALGDLAVELARTAFAHADGRRGKAWLDKVKWVVRRWPQSEISILRGLVGLREFGPASSVCVRAAKRGALLAERAELWRDAAGFLEVLGALRLRRGALSLARQALLTCVRLARRVGATEVECEALIELAKIARRQRRSQVERRCLQRALATRTLPEPRARVLRSRLAELASGGRTGAPPTLDG